jgi:DNA-binding MarR family transcriptional regulator
MARLDAWRLGAWRGLQSRVAEVERGIDAALRAEWDIPLNWFDVLAALQRLGGAARPSDVAVELGLPLSSLSRRLDRLEEDGWVTRRRAPDLGDFRAIEVSLTRRGRNLWRAMNVTYRRAVQDGFARELSDEQIDVIHEVLSVLTPEVEPDADVADDDLDL